MAETNSVPPDTRFFLTPPLFLNLGLKVVPPSRKGGEIDTVGGGV